MKVISAANGAYKEIIELSTEQNKKRGYEPHIYDLGGLGHGEPFDPTPSFEYTKDRTFSKSPFKPFIIKKALEDFRETVVWLDADAMAIRKFDDAISDDYDIGVCMRRQSERGGTLYPEYSGYINAGVLFFNYTPKTMEFMDHWIKMLPHTFTQSDQQALVRLCMEATDFKEYNKVFVHPRFGTRIKVFEGDEYNFYYYPEEPFLKTKIVHLKGEKWLMIKAIRDWGSREWVG